MSGVWAKSELDLLRREYADTPTRDLAQRLGRTERAVYQQARIHGLRKSSEYLANSVGRLDGTQGAGSRFTPGHQPWNAGMKGWNPGGRCLETQFKPGERRGAAARNWLPIGSERIAKDGVRQRKVTDTGYAPRDWVAAHALLWKEHHGPIPAGHIVVFRNGDRSDIRIDNLELISRAENMRRNTVHRLPKELAEVIQLRGALQRQINERTKA